MRSNIVLPYKTLSTSESLRVEPWKSIDDNSLDLSKGIEGWDYESDIGFEREVYIDLDECFSQCGFHGTSAKISLLVSVESGKPGNSYRRLYINKPLPVSGIFHNNISVRLLSSGLAGSVKLNTELILQHRLYNTEPFTAYESGSRLWSEQIEILLEGSLGRFPMQAVDFAETFSGKHSNAMWYLHWEPENLNSSFAGNVLLFINTRKKQFLERIKQGDQLTLSVMMSDVIREMCFKVIDSEELMHLGEYEEDSVGAVVREWLEYSFGEITDALRERKKSNSAELAAIMQSMTSGEI